MGGGGGSKPFLKNFQGSRVLVAHPHPKIPKVPPPGISSLKEIQLHQKNPPLTSSLRHQYVVFKCAEDGAKRVINFAFNNDFDLTFQ